MVKRKVTLLTLFLSHLLLASNVNATSIQGVAVNPSSQTPPISSAVTTLSGGITQSIGQSTDANSPMTSQTQDIAELKRRADESDQKMVRLAVATQDLKDTSDQLKVNISEISNQQNVVSQTTGATQITTSANNVVSGITQSAGATGMAGILGISPTTTQAGINNGANTSASPSNNTLSVASILGIPNANSATSTQGVSAAVNGAVTQAAGSPALVAGITSPNILPAMVVQPPSVDAVNTTPQRNTVYPPPGYYPPSPPGYPPPGYYPPPPNYYPPTAYYPQAGSGMMQSIPDSKQSNVTQTQLATQPGAMQPNLPQGGGSPGYHPPVPGYYPYMAQQQGIPAQNYPSYPPPGYYPYQPGYPPPGSVPPVYQGTQISPGIPDASNATAPSTSAGATTMPVSAGATTASTALAAPAPVVSQIADILSSKLFGSGVTTSSSSAVVAAPAVTPEQAAYAGVHATPGTGLPGVPGVGLPGAPGVGLPGAPGVGLPGAPGVGLPGAPGAGLPGLPGVGLPGTPGVGLPGAPLPSQAVSGQQAIVKPPVITLQEILRQREILKQQPASAQNPGSNIQAPPNVNGTNTGAVQTAVQSAPTTVKTSAAMTTPSAASVASNIIGQFFN